MMQGLNFFNTYTLADKHYSIFNAINNTRQWAFGSLASCCSADIAPVCDDNRLNRQNRFRAAILEHAPDLLVTVYHMELLDVLHLSRSMGGLPLLHLGTDMDMKMHEVFNSMPSYRMWAE